MHAHTRGYLRVHTIYHACWHTEFAQKRQEVIITPWRIQQSLSEGQGLKGCRVPSSWWQEVLALRGNNAPLEQEGERGRLTGTEPHPLLICRPTLLISGQNTAQSQPLFGSSSTIVLTQAPASPPWAAARDSQLVLLLLLSSFEDLVSIMPSKSSLK